ncbi:MAG: hypothetical protein QG655_2889 [Actinomycetota bacterium]|jgi:hypothetical protein|nr:hypothetical protein [Actinomycetota bacterium]
MFALIDWILSLFRSEDAARAFVNAPEQAMRDAGLTGISAAQLSSVATTAVPGLVLGGGDPIVGLQRAVANQYGFAPAFSPQPSFDPVWAPAPTYAPAAAFAPETTFAPQTTTDLASHNDTALFSPPQAAGANAQLGGFNLGFGDITLGSKTTTTTTATAGGVVVGRDAGGDIVSGEGAVLGNANSVTNGDIRSDHGSNVATAEGAVIRDSGTTTTSGGDAAVHLGAATTTTTTTEVTSTTISDNSDSSSHVLFDGGYDTTLVGTDLDYRADLDYSRDLDNSRDLSLASGNQLGSHLFGF